eukprot:1632155-Pleurochrysis_carterae.AAC.1
MNGGGRGTRMHLLEIRTAETKTATFDSIGYLPICCRMRCRNSSCLPAEQRAMAKVRPPCRSAFRLGGGVPPRYAVIARPLAPPAPSQAHGSLHELGSMWSN